MTFHQIDINRLTQEAYREFKCDERTVRGAYDRKDREKARKTIDKVAARFFRIMNASNPPSTKKEMLAMALPVWWLVLNLLWSAVAEKILNWLWERTQGE